mmetsp:Transcript_20910/g.34509  ORF Transcript_20910/g.34509 Transcript_20910/m.34509 type:complete len:204 (-) Transcript_20910:145-756(-)
MQQVEHASLDRVETSHLLRGITPSGFARIEKDIVPMQHGAVTMLADAAAAGVAVHVCSANWSSEWIRRWLDVAADAVHGIHSNDLVLDNAGVATGGLQRSIVSAADKLRCFEALRQERPHVPGRDEHATVFVGDAIADVSALCAADIGVVIGDNRLLRAALRCADIETLLPLRDVCNANGAQPGVYVAADWQELRTSLLDVVQ